MKLVSSLLPCVPLLFGVALAVEPPASPRLTLAAATTTALESNPAVLAARIDVQAASEARRGAGAPGQNPEVSVGAAARLTPEGPQADVGVSFAIPLDLGGTPRHLRVRETAGLERARALLRGTELRVSTATRVAFAEVVAAELRLGLAEESVALGREVEQAARRRHELGEVSILEPTFAALDRAAAEGQRSQAFADLAAATQRLRALLALPADAPLALERGADPSWPPALTEDPEALVARAVAARGEVGGGGVGVGAAWAYRRAAGGAGGRGVWVGGGWEREGDEAHVVGGEVAFEIPVQRNQIEVAEARQRASRASLEASTVERQVAGEVRAALAAWQAASERHGVTTGESLALAEESLRLVLRAYESGEEELLAVLFMQRQALDARRAAIDAELDLHRAASALERAVGELIF